MSINHDDWVCSSSNSVEGINTCRGHERSIKCLAIQGGKLMASGSFDNTVKIWDANLVTEAAEGSSVPEGRSEAKRAKTGGESSGRVVTRTPCPLWEVTRKPWPGLARMSWQVLLGIIQLR